MVTNQYRIPVWDTLSEAWVKTHGAKLPILLGFIIIIVSIFVLAFFIALTTGITDPQNPYVSSLLQLVYFILTMGILYIGLRRATSQDIQYKMMFHSLNFNIFLNLLLLYFLQVVIFIPIIIAAILEVLIVLLFHVTFYHPAVIFVGVLIAPIACITTFYLFIRFMYCYPFVLEYNTSAIQAMKLSWKITRYNFWELTALLFLQVIILTVSIIPFGIGLIWTLPFTVICYGVIFKNLQSNLS